MNVVLWVIAGIVGLLLVSIGVATWKAVRTVRRRRTVPLAVPAHEPWPALPVTGFVTGRVATREDVEAGNAAIAVNQPDGGSGSRAGVSVPLEIPQFALVDDHESNTLVRVVVIQAETAQGRELIGYRRLDNGAFGAGLRWEFMFLGREPALTEAEVRRDRSVRSDD